MCSRTLQRIQVKGNGTVVYSLGFVTFFEHWGDKSMTPVCVVPGQKA